MFGGGQWGCWLGYWGIGFLVVNFCLQGLEGLFQDLKDDDRKYIKMIHGPSKAPEACVAFSPAHLVSPNHEFKLITL